MNDWKTSDLIGLGSVLAFVLTIFYVYGYSKVIDVDLFMYLSLNDYFRLAIGWVTPILTAFLIGFLVNKFFTRVERGATEEELVQSSRFPRFTKFFRKSPDVGIPIVIFVAAIFHTILFFFKAVPKDQVYGIWSIAAPLFWLSVVNWYMKVPRLTQDWSKKWIIFIYGFPALASFAFFYGLTGAESDLRLLEKRVGTEILLKQRSGPLAGEILFILDEYLMLYQREHSQVTIIPKSEIATIIHRKAK